MTPKYTSKRQFANMLDKRAKELREIAGRLNEHGGLGEAAEHVGDAVDDLARAAEKLRTGAVE